MSLINKMLQELDQRGFQTEVSLSGSVVASAAPKRSRKRLIVGLLGILLFGLLIIGFGLFFKGGMRKVNVSPPPMALVRTGPVTTPLVTLAPINIPSPPQVEIADSAPPMPTVASKSASNKPRPKLREEVQQNKAFNTAPNTALLNPLITTNPSAQKTSELSDQQRAENAYRRALGALQDGRATEAMAGLQQALVIEPNHDAARQTLIRLMLENNRPDDAMRQLQQALALDAAQPAMAMMLARMQLDKGGAALDTLSRTLPFALGNGEYQAFFAGVLQRQQRFKEAGEHYDLALRTAPQNGVWWMGLGIALQAQRRVPEAKEAFIRAQNSANLPPELQAFVERKLQQLTH